MKKILSISLTLLASSFLCPLTFAQDVGRVVKANNQFAFELYSKLKSAQGNIFFSPYSISSALVMAYEGAKGETGQEIQYVFHFPAENSLRRASFQKIHNQINAQDRRSVLRSANALWAQIDYPFLEDCITLMKDAYAGKARNLDFINQNEGSRLTINTWVEEQTNSKIKNLLPSLDLSTRLVLTSAVYFKGFWLTRFDKQNTKEEGFRIAPGNTIKTLMMNLNPAQYAGSKEEFRYGETEELQILELSYQGEDLYMLVLLPKNDDLNALEESLNVESLSKWKRLLEWKEVVISLPKFKFEQAYSLKDALTELGMPSAFSEGEADFSGMTGTRDLFIGSVIHKAFVEVNEEGTEAAAATAVTMAGGAVSDPDRVKVFKADHPFIFLIQDLQTNSILFIGRVSDPTA